MATFTGGSFGNDFDQLDIVSLSLGTISSASAFSFADSLNGQIDNFYGAGFTYGPNGFPTAGTVNEIHEIYFGAAVFDLTGLNVPIATILGWAATSANETARSTVFGGADLITGSSATDNLRGYDGADTINAGAGNDFVDGGAGNDQIFGGPGDDVIVDSSGTNYLRGEDGNDIIQGGSGFDDANGNQGNDTINTGGGDDYSVGGKGDDVLFGDAGNDIVWGNLGNDTCDGGDGNDQVRGGQGDDSLSGGTGNDFISGDRGNDTESGGSGADIFHGSQDAGVDRVLDFHLSEGDRVQLDPGTTYTASQVGADTVIDMGGGNQMILVGVQFASLTPGWIFLG